MAVIAAPQAGRIVVSARVEGGTALFLAPRDAPELTAMEHRMIDGQAAADLLFADSAVVNTLVSNAGLAADALIETRYAALAASSEVPGEEVLAPILRAHFQTVVYRAPTRGEEKDYDRLFRQTAREGGTAGDARLDGDPTVSEKRRFRDDTCAARSRAVFGVEVFRSLSLRRAPAAVQPAASLRADAHAHAKAT